MHTIINSVLVAIEDNKKSKVDLVEVVLLFLYKKGHLKTKKVTSARHEMVRKVKSF